MIRIVSIVAEELGELEGWVLGVGGVPAAVAMSALLHTHRPDGVVMLGTGGTYPGGPAVGKACVVERVGSAAGMTAMGLGYTPRPPRPLTCDRRLLERSPMPRVGALSTGAVSTDAILVERLSDGWQVEQVEIFGVAAACAAAGVPFTAILGITHIAGPSAHVQWLANRATARQAARAAVSELISLR